MKVFVEGKYLKYQDLGEGVDTVVTIERVAREELKSADGTMRKKFVVYFRELGEKGLVLNTTNMNTIIRLMGTSESDEWLGRKIVLIVRDDIEMGGELVSGIRVRSKLPL